MTKSSMTKSYIWFMKVRKWRHRTSAAVAIAGIMIIGLAAPGQVARGTNGADGVSGTYVGRIAFTGVAGVDTAAMGGGGDNYTYWDYNHAGPLTLTLTNGSMDGQWKMEGPANFYSQAAAGSLLLFRQVTNWNVVGEGVLSGAPGNYLLTGDFNWTGSTTREQAGLGTRTYEEVPETYTHNVPLTDVLISCNLVSGRWDQQATAAFSSAGLVNFLYAYFNARAVRSEDDNDAVRSQVEGLTNRINEWASGAPEVTPDGQLTYLLDAHDMLDFAQQLAAQPAVSGQCVDPCDFITPLAMAADAALRSLITNMPGSTNSTMASLALGSGALSRCADGVLEGLRDLLRSDLETRIENLLADGAEQDPIWELELLDAARTAQMLGVDKIGPGGISPSDIFILLGAS
jgi:hypothetical protein